MLQPEETPSPQKQDSHALSPSLSFIAPLVMEAVLHMERAMPRFIEDIQTLCLTESPSEDKAGLDAMAVHLATMLQRVGMHTSLIEHARGNAVLGMMDGDNPAAPSILLLGHHDTVHPVGVAVERTRLDGARFYGPGTVDMKAGLLQGIYALEMLHQRRFRAFHKILFLSVSDEEIASRYHVGLIGQVAQELPLVLGLEGASAIGTVVTRRKGCAQYRLTAEGLPAHAGSNPENGRNAVLELAHQIVQAQSFNGWRPGFTINAGPVRGGSRANIVSDFAEIVFDIRFLRQEDRIAAEERWRELLRQQMVPGVKLTLRAEPDSMPPMVADEKSLSMAARVQFIVDHILHTPFAPETRGGASDCCNTAMAGCPSIDGLGAIGGGAHTAEEYVSLPPVPQRVALLCGLIAAIAR